MPPERNSFPLEIDRYITCFVYFLVRSLRQPALKEFIDDLCQEVRIDVWKLWGKGQDLEDVRKQVAVIARRRLCDLCRRLPPRTGSLRFDPIDRPLSDSSIDREETATIILEWRCAARRVADHSSPKSFRRLAPKFIRRIIRAARRCERTCVTEIARAADIDLDAQRASELLRLVTLQRRADFSAADRRHVA